MFVLTKEISWFLVVQDRFTAAPETRVVSFFPKYHPTGPASPTSTPLEGFALTDGNTRMVIFFCSRGGLFLLRRRSEMSFWGHSPVSVESTHCADVTSASKA